MRFSLIVPVYNVEKYIDKCMQSLAGQTFRDYEIIVVDDESPDGSMEIAEKYRAADPERFTILHQKNTRQGGARNNGVRHAKGEYLLFIDSDDYVSPRMLETVDGYLKQTPCDILAFGHIPVDDQGRSLPQEIGGDFPPGLYRPSENHRVVSLPGAPWGKAFRREFYVKTGFQFPEKVLYEDVTTRIVYAQAETILLCQDRLYYYVHRENSSMTQKLSRKNLDILKVTDLVKAEFQRLGLYDTFRQELEPALIYCVLCIVEIVSTVQWNHPLMKPLAEYLRDNFPDYGKNPNADPELLRVLNCLQTMDFKGYHYRFLLKNRFKERLLRMPLVARLNQLRKKD